MRTPLLGTSFFVRAAMSQYFNRHFFGALFFVVVGTDFFVVDTYFFCIFQWQHNLSGLVMNIVFGGTMVQRFPPFQHWLVVK